MEPAGRWLADRQLAQGRGRADFTRPAQRGRRFDRPARENQRKLEAVEALAELAEEAGLSLTHLAIALVLEHPAVTSAIIGPRTMEQLESQLGADEVWLAEELLDRIDEE